MRSWRWVTQRKSGLYIDILWKESGKLVHMIISLNHRQSEEIRALLWIFCDYFNIFWAWALARAWECCRRCYMLLITLAPDMDSGAQHFLCDQYTSLWFRLRFLGCFEGAVGGSAPFLFGEEMIRESVRWLMTMTSLTHCGCKLSRGRFGRMSNCVG